MQFVVKELKVVVECRQGAQPVVSLRMAVSRLSLSPFLAFHAFSSHSTRCRGG